MVLWKNYVILFGGFIDVGVKSKLPLASIAHAQPTICPISGSLTSTRTSGTRSSTSTKTARLGENAPLESADA